MPEIRSDLPPCPLCGLSHGWNEDAWLRCALKARKMLDYCRRSVETFGDYEHSQAISTLPELKLPPKWRRLYERLP